MHNPLDRQMTYATLHNLSARQIARIVFLLFRENTPFQLSADSHEERIDFFVGDCVRVNTILNRVRNE